MRTQLIATPRKHKDDSGQLEPETNTTNRKRFANVCKPQCHAGARLHTQQEEKTIRKCMQILKNDKLQLQVSINNVRKVHRKRVATANNDAQENATQTSLTLR